MERENNITVGESRLKGVVPEKLEMPEPRGIDYSGRQCVNAYNGIIDKILSTPLPPVEDCVLIDVEKLAELLEELNMFQHVESNNSRWGGKIALRPIAKAIANSKSILKS